jgi:HEAT repeat protein
VLFIRVYPRRAPLPRKSLRALIPVLAALGGGMLLIHHFTGFLEGLDKISPYIEEFLETYFKLSFAESEVVTYALLGLILLAAAILAVVLHRIVSPHEAKSELRDQAAPTAAGGDRVRRAYLEFMKLEVENRLKASIHGVLLLDLQLTERNNAALPWYFVAASPNANPQQYTDIDKALHEHQFRLLLLGDPGSGKTTSILQLAQRYIDAALQNPDQPIPLLENLSRFQRLPLTEQPEDKKWLRSKEHRQAQRDDLIQNHLSELVGALRVPGLNSSVVNGWIEDRNIIFLFDGLDEVEDIRRPALVTRLNKSLLTIYSDTPIVVCSRVVEYQVLEHSDETKIRLNGAVTLQPLNPKQIEEYLKSAGAVVVAEMLHNDEALQQLASNPLMLSIMTLAYQGRGGLTTNVSPTLPDRRRQLFDDFINRMMQREACRRTGQPWDPYSSKFYVTLYSRHSVDHFLGRLAVALSERMETRLPARYPAMFLSSDNVAGIRRFFSTYRIANVLLAILSGFCLSTFSGLATPDFPVLYLTLAAVGAAIGYLLLAYADYSTGDTELFVIPFIATWAVTLPAVGGVSVWRLTNGYLEPSFAAIAIPLTWMMLSLWSERFNWRRLVILVVGGGSIGIVAGEIYWPGLALSIGMTAGAAALGAAIALEPSRSRVPSWLTVTLGVCAGAIVAVAFGYSAYFLKIAPGQSRLLLELVDVSIWVGIILYMTGASLAVGATCIFILLGAEWITIASVAIVTVAMIEHEILGHRARSFEMRLAHSDAGKRWLWSKKPVTDANSIFLSPVILIILKLRREIPWRFWRFMNYATDSLFLRKTSEGYGFIHLLLRDHFAVLELTPSLMSDNLNLRISAIRKLGYQGEASIDSLCNLLHDDKPTIRLETVRALARIPSPAIAPIMLDILQNSTDSSMRAAAIAVATRAKDDEAKELIALAVEDRDSDVRLSAANYYFPRFADWCHDYTVTSLADSDNRIVRGAILSLAGRSKFTVDDEKSTASQILKDNGPRLTKILNELLHDKDANCRREAAEFIGRASLRQASGALLNSLGDSDKGVRLEALRSLTTFAAEIALPAAIIASRAADDDVRQMAVEHLAKITRTSDGISAEQVETAISVLRPALHDRSPNVKAAAVGSILWKEDSDMLSIVREALADRSAKVRSSALLFIAQASSDQLVKKTLSQFIPDAFRNLSSPDTVYFAARALSALRDFGVIHTLIELVDRHWSRQQFGAVLALGLAKERTGEGAITRLTKRLLTVRGRCAEQPLKLGRMFGLYPGPRVGLCIVALAAIGSGSGFESLKDLLKDTGPGIKRILVRFLVFGSTESRAFLIQTLRQKDEVVIDETIRVLQATHRVRWHRYSISEDEKDRIEYLIDVLRDESHFHGFSWNYRGRFS